MYGIKDKSTGDIVSTTDQEQSKFGGPWADPDLFEFVPNYVRPKTVSEVSDNITSEADKRVDAHAGDDRAQRRQLAAFANLMDMRHGRPLSAGEQAQMDALKTAYAYYSAIRAAEEAAIASLSGMTQEQLNSYNPENGPSWPIAP